MRHHKRLIAAGLIVASGLFVLGLRNAPLKSTSLQAAEEAPAADQQLIHVKPGKSSWASFRNGNQQLGVAGSKLPEKLELLWKVASPDGFVGTSSIVGNHVYAPALSGDLLCLELKTGKQVWKYRSIDNPDPKEFAPGFKAAPRITEKFAIVGDEDGFIHCVNRTTGKRVWKFETGAEIAGCPALIEDRIVVGSHDAFLYCLKVDTGELVWKYETLDRINCAPAISGNHTFVAGCDSHMRVINIATGKQESEVNLQSFMIASPAVIDNMLYVGTHEGTVIALDWKTSTVAWTYKDAKREQPYHASAAVTNKFVVVGGHDKQMHCINRKNGDEVWVFGTKAQINSSAAVVDNRVYFGSNDGNLYGLNLTTGVQIWKYNVGKDVTAGVAIGENCLVVGADGRKGELHCFGAK